MTAVTYWPPDLGVCPTLLHNQPQSRPIRERRVVLSLAFQAAEDST
jgi:hypothetical protein